MIIFLTFANFYPPVSLLWPSPCSPPHEVTTITPSRQLCIRPYLVKKPPVTKRSPICEPLGRISFFLTRWPCVSFQEHPFLNIWIVSSVWKKRYVARLTWGLRSYLCKLKFKCLLFYSQIDEFVVTTTKKKGWLTDYSVRHNYSSPARIDELLRDFSYLSGSLNAVARHTMETLKNIFDVHTVSEWMEQKILPLFEKLDRIRLDAAALRSQSHWPVRPLPLFDRWSQYNLHIEDYFNVSTTTTQPYLQ